MYINSIHVLMLVNAHAHRHSDIERNGIHTTTTLSMRIVLLAHSSSRMPFLSLFARITYTYHHGVNIERINVVWPICARFSFGGRSMSNGAFIIKLPRRRWRTAAHLHGSSIRCGDGTHGWQRSSTHTLIHAFRLNTEQQRVV